MLKLVDRNCLKPPISKQYYLLQTFATENTAVFSRRDTYGIIVSSLLLGIVPLANIYENSLKQALAKIALNIAPSLKRCGYQTCSVLQERSELDAILPSTQKFRGKSLRRASEPTNTGQTQYRFTTLLQIRSRATNKRKLHKKLYSEEK